jgi:spermidine synthase
VVEANKTKLKFDGIIIDCPDLHLEKGHIEGVYNEEFYIEIFNLLKEESGFSQ